MATGMHHLENQVDSTSPFPDGLRAVLESVPDATVVTDERGSITFANTQAAALFGYGEGELTGQMIEVLVPERFRSSHVAKRGRFAAEHHARPIGAGLGLFGRRKDGTEFPADISLAPMRSAAGNGVMAAIRDVTAARQERDQLDALYQVALSSSGVLDPAALGEIAIERACALLQADDATLFWWDESAGSLRVLSDTRKRISPRNVAVGEGTAGMAFKRGEPVIVEDYPNWEHAAKDSLERGLKSAVGVPLLVRTRPVGALTVSFKSRQQFKPGDLRLLSLLAAQLAPALESARLHDTVVQISSELQSASNAKSDFLANMSHELRTPLNAILGFAELLIDEPHGGYDATRRVQFLTQIHTSGKHLLSLINDILDLAKVEAGQMELARSHFDLAATIRAAIETVQPLAAERGLQLSAGSVAETALFADENKVRQMLLNLLSNAIKFTPDGGRVTVTAIATGGEVTVCVADTGIGISPDDQKRLFMEFQQLDRRKGHHVQGTGLGLALTKRIAELHRGRVWVESEPEVGSRFFFALPLVPAADQPVGAAPDVPHAMAGPLIMIVEDEQNAAAVLSFTLRRAGFRVKVVRGGHDVLDQAANLKPDAITLDILLPDVNGWEILRSLKESPDTRNIPVVVVSVLDDRSLGFALGADDYLVKPVRRDALLAFMTRHGLTGRVRGEAVTILAVDDDPVALELLKENLASHFKLLTATDGALAVEVARTEQPDAVILDLMMPNMSGFEVASALKSHLETRDIPILILTAKNLTQEERSRLNGHANTVMRKGQAGADELLRWLERQPAAEPGK